MFEQYNIDRTIRSEHLLSKTIERNCKAIEKHVHLQQNQTGGKKTIVTEQINNAPETSEINVEEFFRQTRDAVLGIPNPKTIESDELFDKQLEKRKFLVSGILPEGLVLLAAPPKAGKSFFVLGLCVAVAKGEPFLGFPTSRGRALYFCFEDDEKRLQKRMFEITDEAFPGLTFCTEVIKLEDGKFISYLESHMRKYPDTKLIVVDTLNYIRTDDGGANMYKRDYDDIIPLHDFAQKHGVTMVLVHHTRKTRDGDEYSAASGSTGLTGAVDTYLLLKRPKRSDSEAVLFISGRDIETTEIEIVHDRNGLWKLKDENTFSEKGICDEVKAVFLSLSWFHDTDSGVTVSATELSNLVKDVFSIQIPSNMITKLLTANHEDLESLGLSFQCKRTKTGRLLIFKRNDNYSFPPIVFGESGSFSIDESFDTEIVSGDLSGDGGDGVTAEIHSDDFSPSAVNRDGDSPETEEEKVSDGDGSDAPVTADSRCESSCQPVTPSQNGAKGGSGQKQNSGKRKKKKSKKKPKKNADL